MNSIYNDCFKGLQPQPDNPFNPFTSSTYGVSKSGLCHTILGIGPDYLAKDGWNFHRRSFLKDIILDDYNLSVRLHNPRRLQCVFTSKETKGTLWKIAKNIQYVAAMVLFYLGGCFTTYISNLVKVLRYEASTGKEAKVLYQNLTSIFLLGYGKDSYEDLKTAKKIANFMPNGPKTREFFRCRIISGQLRGLGLSMVDGNMKDYVELNYTEELFREVIEDWTKTPSSKRKIFNNFV